MWGFRSLEKASDVRLFVGKSSLLNAFIYIAACAQKCLQCMCPRTWGCLNKNDSNQIFFLKIRIGGYSRYRTYGYGIVVRVTSLPRGFGRVVLRSCCTLVEVEHRYFWTTVFVRTCSLVIKFCIPRSWYVVLGFLETCRIWMECANNRHETCWYTCLRSA